MPLVPNVMGPPVSTLAGGREWNITCDSLDDEPARVSHVPRKAAWRMCLMGSSTVTDANTAALTMMLVRLTPRHVPRLDRWSTNNLQLALLTPDHASAHSPTPSEQRHASNERARSPFENMAHTVSRPRQAWISRTFTGNNRM